jgi:hypothetical protein
VSRLRSTMRPALRVLFVVAALLLASFALAGCQGETTPVRSLLDDPTAYDGQTVRVAGTCVGGVGILGYGVYQVDDGTGRITVVSEHGGAPREGAKVGVEGTFRAAFVLKTETVAALVETKRHVQ